MVFRRIPQIPRSLLFLLPITSALGQVTIQESSFDCKFAIENLKFDLTSLGERSALRTRETPPSKMIDTVFFNLCEDLKEKEVPKQDQCPAGTRCCLTKLNTKDGENDRIVAVIPVVQTSTLNYSTSLIPSAKGVSLVFSGASYPQSAPDSKPQTLNMTLLCTNEASQPQLKEYDGSLLEIEWSVPEACGSTGDKDGNEGGSDNGNDDKESVGSGIGWFFLVLLLAFAAYFGLGAYYNYSTYGASGMDLIPSQVDPLVNGLSGARHVKFGSKDEARTAYEEARARGEVKEKDADTLPQPLANVGNGNASESNVPSPSNSTPSHPSAAGGSRLSIVNEPVSDASRPFHSVTPTTSLSPRAESTTLVNTEQNTTSEQGQRRLGVNSRLHQNTRTLPQQQPSTSYHPPSPTRSLDSDRQASQPSPRIRPSLIQRDIDSDLSEPESLVSVEIIDRSGRTRTEQASPPPALAQAPVGIRVPKTPERRAKGASVDRSRRSSSSHDSNQIYQSSSSTSTSSFASMSSRSMEPEVDAMQAPVNTRIPTPTTAQTRTRSRAVARDDVSSRPSSSSTSPSSFQIQRSSSSTSASTSASRSSSRRAIVAVEPEEDGYPSATDSSGPEEVTPRKLPAFRGNKVQGKGKGKEKGPGKLTLISSDDDIENFPGGGGSDSSYSAVSSLKARANSPEITRADASRTSTPSRQSRSTPVASGSGGSRSRIDSTRASRGGSQAHDGASTSDGTRRGETRRSITLAELGFTEPPQAFLVYKPGSDPRSPMRKTVHVPDTEGSSMLFRMSPRPQPPLNLALADPGIGARTEGSPSVA
ncbi:type II membrane protein [Marasmius crinis-equi]|uniref:Autophagy-related protein 27 n=1 Tax=Marasmius crinis-equi TaxID=585013 RepID=A0ABR3FK27_9AGAR